MMHFYYVVKKRGEEKYLVTRSYRGYPAVTSLSKEVSILKADKFATPIEAKKGATRYLKGQKMLKEEDLEVLEVGLADPVVLSSTVLKAVKEEEERIIWESHHKNANDYF